jgi:hypothetical protein
MIVNVQSIIMVWHPPGANEHKPHNCYDLSIFVIPDSLVEDLDRKPLDERDEKKRSFVLITTPIFWVLSRCSTLWPRDLNSTVTKDKAPLSTMGDDDDFVIESTDAGASTTIPMEAGQIKKGG